MNSSCRTYSHAFAAHPALRIIDISYVVCYGDRLERTFLGAFATADTSVGASLAGGGSLIFIYARHVNPA